jgi:hypothetical protein
VSPGQFTSDPPDFAIDNIVVDVVATPAPAALPLFATGLAGFAWFARRRRRQPAA